MSSCSLWYQCSDWATWVGEGWRYQHVQAIIVAIDQYAEAATGNRDYFLNKPYKSMRADVP